MTDLLERARVKAAMITMGEKISFGSDSGIILELVEEIERITAALQGSVVMPAGEATAYRGPMIVDAGLLHALWCYGVLNPVRNVIYGYGAHQKALDDADKLLFDRARSLEVTRHERDTTTSANSNKGSAQ